MEIKRVVKMIVDKGVERSCKKEYEKRMRKLFESSIEYLIESSYKIYVESGMNDFMDIKDFRKDFVSRYMRNWEMYNNDWLYDEERKRRDDIMGKFKSFNV